jgi:NADH-quinone oxidoreductase subunit H
VGPFGALQPLVDIVKLAAKEDFAPRNASKAIFIIAPMISLITAIATIAIVPFGNTVTDGVFGANYTLYGIDVSIGVLYAFAFGAISFYGLMLGGWASGSKYSFLGAMRSAAQLISYELAAGLSLVGVVMMSGSLSMTEIVNQQDGMWFIVPQFVGFLVFLVAAFAETNRAPFDLVEADAELVAGYQTEYGGMRFASFMMAEYMNMIILAGIGVTMFLGGWHGPGPGWLDPIWVLVKIAVFMVVFVWIRATLPRLRYDQLMSFGWKILVPLATINLMVTAILVTV